MRNFDFDAEAEARRLDEKIKALQLKKAEIAEKVEEAKFLNGLARKVGLLIVKKFEGKPFQYEDLRDTLNEVLIADTERTFFDLAILPADDPRRPKRRGRKPREEVEG